MKAPPLPVRTWSVSIVMLAAPGSKGPSSVRSEFSRFHERPASGGIVRRLGALAAGACAALLSGCALYHSLPLPKQPDLAGQLSQLHTRLPAVPGEPQRTLAIDGPLNIDDIGLLAVLNDPDLR